MLKQYQIDVVKDIEGFFNDLNVARDVYQNTPAMQSDLGYVGFSYANNAKYLGFNDRPQNGLGELYPRVCVKMPTGGGKTLIAIETIRGYQNRFVKRKTGLVIWITHRDQIYRQTIQNLQNKSHVYRQFLDQISGNRTIIAEKGQAIHRQDVEENLVILMIMIQSARKAETNKMFEDSGGYTDFFPPENRYDEHEELLKQIPNLDKIEDSLLNRAQVKTSLGNLIRTQNPLLIVDELHTMWTPGTKAILDGLNPSMLVGLSATPKDDMNIVSEVTGKALEAEDMIKLPMHLLPPSRKNNWQNVMTAIKAKREYLEQKAKNLEQNNGAYIRPIALIQVERIGRDQRGQGFVHSEDVQEWLIKSGVPKYQIALKTSLVNEIKNENLLSRESEVRYIITKEALKEGWDCSFAYILGVIPNAQNNNSMTQLVGRVLRQPYAKKTGIKDLDESYIYFVSGQTQEVLNKVVKGFEDEGLKDVAPGIQAHDRQGTELNPPKTIKIKQKMRRKYPESLLLPVWLIKNGNKFRKFSYDIDIKPGITWDLKGKITKWVAELVPTLGQQHDSVVEYLVSLDEGAETRITQATVAINFDKHYLSRRLNETINNAFVAHEIAVKVMELLKDKTATDLLDREAGHIASFIERKLVEHKREQEKGLFEDLVKANRLTLVITDDNKLGFEMPEKDIIPDTRIPSSYQLSLYDDVDANSMNELEKKVAGILDSHDRVIWWTRNKVQRNWYAIQGWQRDKIRPDFVAAIKNDNNDLEFVYVIESKGEHLMGNTDTEYKTEVFETMNRQKFKTTTIKMNDKFEFELVPDKEEETRIKGRLGKKVDAK